MNIVANTELNFHGVILTPVSDVPGTWLTASQIGYALQYADDKAVQRIYSRHSDEFTDKMTRVVNLTTPSGTQATRVFSLRGAHLLAMFARTQVAKEFRRWVLDILDHETACSGVSNDLDKIYSMQFTSRELCNVAWLFKAALHMREEMERSCEGLRMIGSPFGTSMGIMQVEYKNVIEDVRKVLAREISLIQGVELTHPNWLRVLPSIMIH
jgi:prophage antirepressor-like protein